MSTDQSIHHGIGKQSRERLADDGQGGGPPMAAQVAQTELTEAKKQLEQILASITEGYYALDGQWQFVALNPVAADHFGRPPADLIGRNIWRETGTPPDSDIYLNFLKARQDGRYHRFDAHSRIRPSYWAEMHLYPHKETLHVYFKDISQRKQMEASLRQSEERFRKVFENAGMGIAITDWHGRFLQCNPAYCRLLGYTEQELQTIEFDALIHPEDREANLAMISRLKSGRLRSFELKNRYLHKKGHDVWVHKYVSIIPDAEGKAAQIMALVDDISRSKKTKALLERLNKSLIERTQQAEQRAKEVQRLALEVTSAEDRERKRLAAILHDDFQQTLAYLKLKLANLHKGAGLATNLATLNTIIDGCIQSCRHLAQELNPRLIEQKGFLGALRWTCRQMKVMHGLDVSLRAPDAVDVPSFDLASLLIRSVRELLFNVVKHSGENHASVRVGIDGDTLTVTVADTGRGCDYDRFAQRPIEESVYGLFSIEDRIHLLGGRVQVRSRPGQGFRVTIDVPHAVGVSLPVATIKVLLADDHEMMRDSLAGMLGQEAGIEVIGLAADGRQAVAMTAAIKPDVVVMDVSMPTMGGIDATRQIKAILPQTGVIGLTMHTDDDIRQAMLAAGAFACLTKAASPDELAATIRSWGIDG